MLQEESSSRTAAACTNWLSLIFRYSTSNNSETTALRSSGKRPATKVNVSTAALDCGRHDGLGATKTAAYDKTMPSLKG